MECYEYSWWHEWHVLFHRSAKRVLGNIKENHPQRKTMENRLAASLVLKSNRTNPAWIVWTSPQQQLSRRAGEADVLDPPASAPAKQQRTAPAG